MELSLFEYAHKRKNNANFTVLLLGITLFYAVVFTPLSLFLSSDILLSETVFPLLCDVLMSLCNYLFYWVSFAYALYGIYRFGIHQSKGLLGIYAGAVFFRYIANQLATYFVLGFPRLESFLKDDFIFLLIYIGLDLLMMTGAVLLICGLKKRWKPEGSMLSHLPIAKLFDKQNPVLRVSVCVAVLPAAVKLISRLIYDFSLGAPADIVDLLWMVIYYLSDFAHVLIGYLVMILFLNRLFIGGEKAKIEFDSASVI